MRWRGLIFACLLLVGLELARRGLAPPTSMTVAYRRLFAFDFIFVIAVAAGSWGIVSQNTTATQFRSRKYSRLRYALPLAQMAIGMALLFWSQAWMLLLTARIHGSVQTTPAFIFLTSLNMPAALARSIWFHHVQSPWDDWFLIPAVGMLWYWVARNIESWLQTGHLLRVRHRVIQLIIDVLLITVGVLIAAVYGEARRGYIVWVVLIQLTFACMWCMVLVFLPLWDMADLLRLVTVGKSPYRK